MTGGHGDGHDELVGDVVGHDLLPQVETWHEGERTRSGFSVLGYQGPDKGHLNLFRGHLEGLQPLLMPLPWMAGGESGG